MEKKFWPELIDSPKTEFEKILNASMVSCNENLIKNGCSGLHRESFEKALTNLGLRLSDRVISKLQSAFADTDQNFQKGVENLLLLKKAGYKKYVFASDFFDLLQSVSIENIPWTVMPKNLYACIRFPRPIIEPRGNEVEEICISISSVASLKKFGGLCLRENCGDERTILTATAYMENGVSVCWSSAFPEDLSEKISDQWPEARVRSKDGVLRDAYAFEKEKIGDFSLLIARCLIYISSGDPDLRKFRNEIRYQSSTSKTPIRAHKDLSEGIIYRVGFNWMKDPLYSSESWGVKPYMRYQPCGPGLSEYRLVMVKEHVRHRRSLNEAGDSANLL